MIKLKEFYYNHIESDFQNELNVGVMDYVNELEKQNEELIKCLINHITCKDSRDLSIYGNISKKTLERIIQKPIEEILKNV